MAYEQVRARVIPDKTYETHVRRFISGATAGCLSVFFTYPLEVIRVRLAFETKREGRSSIVDICKKIYYEHPPASRAPSTYVDTSSVSRAAVTTATAAQATVQAVVPKHGLINFFRGFTPTLWGMLPYAGTSFLAHDTIGDIFRRPAYAQYTVMPKSERRSKDPNKPPQLKAWAELTSGGLAGAISQTVSYPLEVIRRRMQVGGVVGDGHRLGMGETARNILAERGFKGFFVGLGVGYVKILPMSATAFFVYERLKYWMSI